MATVINSSTTGLIVTPDATGQLTLSANGVTALTANTAGHCTFTNNFASVAGYPAYQCRAWVNFNGTGTVAINGNGNVSSITDNGTGDYTVNLTTAMPDTNYAIVTTAGTDNTGTGSIQTKYMTANFSPTTNGYIAPTTSSYRIGIMPGTAYDLVNVYSAIFR